VSYRGLLCHVPSQANLAGHLRCAVELADKFQATIIGLGAAAVPPFALRSGGAYAAVDNQWLSILREQHNAALDAAREVFETVTGERPKTWRTSWMEPTPALAAAARGADLIVVRRPDPRPPDVYTEVDVGPLVVKAGRPVLVCPSHGSCLSDAPALVAWKDSRESRRAVTDALPLLQRSCDVLIVECSPEADTAPAMGRIHDLASALARHGVRARTEVLAQPPRAAEAILTRAAQLGAELIVAGGYGHTRLGEWAFGGVTRSLLEQDRHFVLLSH
jgi:nucleotide-binding universal stress UspA family protein